MSHPLDSIIARQTGFTSMADMLASHPSYRPSLDMREGWARLVADAYDAEQEARGDARRAYRYAIAEGAKIAAAEAAAAAKAARMTPLQLASAKVAEGQKDCRAALRKEYPDLRWVRSRGQLLWVGDGNGERLNGGSWDNWNGTWKQVQGLIEAYPGAKEIWVEIGYNAAETLETLELGDYETEIDDVMIWTKES